MDLPDPTHGPRSLASARPGPLADRAPQTAGEPPADGGVGVERRSAAARAAIDIALPARPTPRPLTSLRRRLLPPLVLSAALAGACATWLTHARLSELLELQSLGRSEAIVRATAQAASVLEGESALQALVAGLGTEQGVDGLTVVGGSPPRVLASTRATWVGLGLDDLPVHIARELEATLGGATSQRRIEREPGRYATALRLDERGGGAAQAVLAEFDQATLLGFVRVSTWMVSLWQLGGVLLTTLFAYLVVRRYVLAPLQAMHRSMRERPAGGGFARPTELAHDELGGLADTLERMLDVSAAQQERISTLVGNVPGAVYRCALDEPWSVLFVSQAIETITGYPAGDFLRRRGRGLASLIHPDDLPGVQRAVRESVGSNNSFELEYRIVHASGESRWVNERGRVVVGRNPGVTWIDGVIWDVTERKRAEQRLEDYVVELEERKEYIEAQADLLREQARELAVARDHALDGARAKSEFLATMSHEIRTPMNGVLGMAELLLVGELAPEQRDLAQTIQSSGEALLAILDDVLDFSKMEAGRLELERVEFDVVDALEDAAELFAERAHAKGVELVVRPVGELPARIVGDPGRLRQVLLNLTSNAVKFTEAGRVVLSVEALADGGQGRARLRFRVTDTGIGIPPEAMPRLFRSFSQADASTTRRYGGTGLGLVIASRLVELMGGAIDVASAVGRGSEFRFTGVFECAAQPSAPEPHPGRAALVALRDEVARAVLVERLAALGVAAIAVGDLEDAFAAARDVRIAGGVLHLLVFEREEHDGELLAAWRESDVPLPFALGVLPYGAGASDASPVDAELRKPVRRKALARALDAALGTQEPPPALPSAALPRERPEGQLTGHVLLVEDNPVNQKLAVALLRRMGHRVDLANDGREALEAATKRRYDVILMDCQMPVLDGFDATRELRRREGDGAHTPIVAMTANAMQGDRERCLAAGMDEYLTKPIRPARLSEMLQRFLGEHRAPLDGAG